MIVSELIEKLKRFPQDTEVMVSRGDWGPCRVTSDPRLAIVEDSGTTEMNWECHYPELLLGEGDDPRLTVVLLD